jgi:hypothetical protein
MPLNTPSVFVVNPLFMFGENSAKESIAAICSANATVSDVAGFTPIATLFIASDGSFLAMDSICSRDRRRGALNFSKASLASSARRLRTRRRHPRVAVATWRDQTTFEDHAELQATVR